MVEGESRVTVFIFDMGGVTIRWNNAPVFKHISKRYGIPVHKLRIAMIERIPEVESGKLSCRDFLEGVLDHFGKGLKQGDDPNELLTSPVAKHVRVNKGTVKLIQSLRQRGFKLCAFTNTSPPHLRLMKSRGLLSYFDTYFASCEMGCVKPQREAFLHVLNSLRVSGDACVFTDDNEANIRGAIDAGIARSILFRSIRKLCLDISQILGAN